MRIGTPPSSLNCLLGDLLLDFAPEGGAMRVPSPAAGTIRNTFIRAISIVHRRKKRHTDRGAEADEAAGEFVLSSKRVWAGRARAPGAPRLGPFPKGQANRLPGRPMLQSFFLGQRAVHRLV